MILNSTAICNRIWTVPCWLVTQVKTSSVQKFAQIRVKTPAFPRDMPQSITLSLIVVCNFLLKVGNVDYIFESNISLLFLFFFFFSAMPWVYGYRLQALLQMLRSRKGKDRRQFFTLVASARKTWKDEVILSFPFCLLVTYTCLWDNPANNCLQSINRINTVHNITIPSCFAWHKNQELCCKILAWTKKKERYHLLHKGDRQ